MGIGDQSAGSRDLQMKYISDIWGSLTSTPYEMGSLSVIAIANTSRATHVHSIGNTPYQRPALDTIGHINKC